jgi:Cd2+/Zn2+-exporting ATPase
MPAKTYVVTGMDCADCARSVERGVKRLENVSTVRVDFATSKMHVDGEVTQDALRQRLEKLGYGLADESALKPEKKSRGGVFGFWDYLNSRRETRLALIGGFLAFVGLLSGFLGVPENISVLIFIVAMAVTAFPIARNGISTLFVNREFNINLLMTIAAIGAVIINEPFEAATVIFLFAIGEALEGYTADRARDSLRSLMELAPAQAQLVDGQVIPVELLRVNDVILVKPGERIPMDGVITEGESDVNQAPITGESIPVQKVKGAEVFAGTINGSGALKINVAHLAADNTLSRIIRMVEEAQSVRAPSQRLVDQFARVYTPAVVVIAILVALMPPLLLNAPFYNLADGTHGWLYRALSLLVIACPCALVISAPVTVISAITAAARRGVLFKGGAHLEALGQVKAFAFDKTGTLTYGNPVVKTARSIDCATGEACASCDDVLALAAAVESSSAHPLAKAVVGAAQQRGLQPYPQAEAVEMLAGQGIRGTITGKPVTVGSHAFFDRQYPHAPEFCSLVQDAEAHGQTTMLLADGERVRGFIGVADAVREDSAKAVEALKALGVETTMLTGDNATVASAVGQQVHVDDVRAGLLPADKVDAVKELRAKYGSVAMVGDGVNDTPALAAATVGIAMGGAGSAQALETADIALMSDDIKQLPFAVKLSRFARALIHQNMAISFGVKAMFLIMALFFDTSLWLAIFADVGVSLLVTLNGMRPLKFS